MEPKPPLPLAENERIAQWLRQMAELLHAQQANPFRVGAYRRAADTIERLQVSVRDVLADRGRDGLDELPGIGRGIAAAVAEILRDRALGAARPAARQPRAGGAVPDRSGRGPGARGADPRRARRRDAGSTRGGEPRRPPGLGAGCRSAARGGDSRGTRRHPRPFRARATDDPIRRRARVVPSRRPRCSSTSTASTATRRRREPCRRSRHVASIPRESRGCRCCTRIGSRGISPRSISNTARAHELGRTRDWVVIYFHDDDHVERQRTVVTETRGPLQGRRVVRGREAECRAWYEAGGNA